VGLRVSQLNSTRVGEPRQARALGGDAAPIKRLIERGVGANIAGQQQ